MKKIDPAVMRIRLGLLGNQTGVGDPQYVDLSQCASIVNRRFYRQGLNWAVAGFRIAGGSSGSVYISKLQNTWVTSGAWEKSMRLWLKQQNDALAESVSNETAARFRDFKIHADIGHAGNTFANNLTPMNDGVSLGTLGGDYLLGEWEESRIVIPNDGAPGVTTEYDLMMHGISTGTHKGLIDGYSLSRNFPHSPDPVSPLVSLSWMHEMFDVGDNLSEITDNAQNTNDDLPYSQTNYPGGGVNAPNMEVHRIVDFSSSNTTGSTWLNVAGTNFPCGLIQIINNNVETIGIEIMLVPGPHRGYLAQPMQDM